MRGSPDLIGVPLGFYIDQGASYGVRFECLACYDSFDAPLLVFECADVAASIARLRELGVAPSPQSARGLDRERSAVIEAPEGTALLLVQSLG